MSVLQAVALLFTAAGAGTLALVRDLVRLVLLTNLYGLLLVVLFIVFQAPDVALSELVVGVAAFPLVLLVVVCRERRR